MKKRLSAVTLITLTLLLAVAAAGFAESVVYSLSDRVVRKVLAGTGSTYEKIDDDAFRFNVGRFKCVFFNEGDNFQLYCGFSDADVSIGDMNRWNRKKRFAKAYIDDEGDPCIEADFTLEGGTTMDNMIEFTELFKSLVGDFAEYIDF